MAERREVSVVEQKAFVDRVERWLPGVVVISALTGFSVLAWYAYTTSNQSSNEEDLITVEADKTPMKEKPLDPGGMKFPNQDKTVFETFANGSQTPPKVERVLPAPEEPMPKSGDTADTKTWVNEKLHKNVKDGARVDSAIPAAAPAPAPAPAREQVIGSNEEDGEVVVPQQAISGGPDMSPDGKAVDKPKSDNVSTSNPEEIMSFKSAAVTAKVKTDDAPASAPVAGASAKPAGPVIKGDTWEDASKNIKVDDDADNEATAAQPAAAPAEKPAEKIEEKPAAPVKLETKPAAKAAPAKVVAAKPAAATHATGGPLIQLGAYQSEKEARTELAKIGKKYAGVSGHPETIYRAVVPGKGTFYRLRLGGFSGSADAKAFCSKLSAGGQACILAKD